MATPIFVIGTNRSGTKWLSNMLCNHSEIIGVLAQEHFGIIGANMFEVMPRKFGDLSLIENYIGLIELWSRTDFFKYAQGRKEMFYKIKPWPTEYYQLFEMLMRDLAERNKKKYWLQKAPPISLRSIMNFFHDGIYIMIRRNFIDQVKSSLKLQINEGLKPSLGTTVFIYVYSQKIVKKYFDKKNMFMLSYEDLKNNTEEQLRMICRTIGIEFEPSMIKTVYIRNTSFKSQNERDRILSRPDLWVVRILYAIMRFCPLPILKILYDIFKNKNPPFLPGTFRGSIH